MSNVLHISSLLDEVEKCVIIVKQRKNDYNKNNYDTVVFAWLIPKKTILFPLTFYFIYLFYFVYRNKPTVWPTHSQLNFLLFNVHAVKPEVWLEAEGREHNWDSIILFAPFYSVDGIF